MILYGPYGPYNIWKVDNICTKYVETISFICSSILEILDIWFLYILQKRRAPKNDEECPAFRAEISDMRPIQGQKLKLFITQFCGVINLPVE